MAKSSVCVETAGCFAVVGTLVWQLSFPHIAALYCGFESNVMLRINTK